ncbi:MAG: 2-isopropylmalate synthase [Ardenticatenaceae bacterium]
MSNSVIKIEPDVVRIFDTTLRDGEQSPGATLHVHEKIEIAKQLARLGVDIIEAGFPAASPGDLDAVRQIAQIVGTPDGPIITGLARTNSKDIDAAWEAVKHAAKPRIHTFLATSDIHMKYKLRMTREQVVKRIYDMVSHAKQYCDDVEFSPEDAGRSHPSFLYEVLAAAIEAGATTLNIPDTVGYTMPDEFGMLIAGIIANTPGLKENNIIVSVHTHDDLGLAVANALAGVRAGARQVECTVNGIGERAGNCSLEEIVMALYTRRNQFELATNIKTSEIHRSSDMVSRYTGIVVQPNKAIVGANAFAHEAGIHQDGMLKNKRTYEIMDAATVGLHESKLVLGKHSGRHAFRVRLEQMGYHLDEEQFQDAFRRFKELADKKKKVTDADIEAVIGDEIYHPVEQWALDTLQVACGNQTIPTATVRLRHADGSTAEAVSIGAGPVDAIYSAIDQIVKAPAQLLEYTVQSVTEGIDAVGDVTVIVENKQADAEILHPQTDKHIRRVFAGRGVDTDIIVASARAYMQALNRMLATTNHTASTVAIAAD